MPIRFIEIMVMEGGKTRKFASAEVSRAELTVRISAVEAKRIYGEIIPLDWSGDTKGCYGYLRRFPVGPVLGIVPFNFPLNLACHKLGPAIAAGNPIVIETRLLQPPSRPCCSETFAFGRVSRPMPSASSRAPGAVQNTW